MPNAAWLVGYPGRRESRGRLLEGGSPRRRLAPWRLLGGGSPRRRSPNAPVARDDSRCRRDVEVGLDHGFGYGSGQGSSCVLVRRGLVEQRDGHGDGGVGGGGEGH